MSTSPSITTESAIRRRQHVARRDVPFIATMVTLTLLKLWLVAWQEVAAQGSARFDD